MSLATVMAAFTEVGQGRRPAVLLGSDNAEQQTAHKISSRFGPETPDAQPRSRPYPMDRILLGLGSETGRALTRRTAEGRGVTLRLDRPYSSRTQARLSDRKSGTISVASALRCPDPGPRLGTCLDSLVEASYTHWRMPALRPRLRLKCLLA